MNLQVISKSPSADPRPTPLLFVHGAWHGAWCWAEHFLDYFAARGYHAHALNLRGHGNSDGRNRLRWTRISDYVADVAQVASALPAPPVVIGHSMGGLVAQKYLETHRAPAGVLVAAVPLSGVLAATLRILRHHPLQFLRANLTLSLYPIIGSPALTREAFFSATMPEAQVRDYCARLQDESYLGFLDMLLLNLPRPKRVQSPVLVLGAADDTMFHPDAIRATARAYATEAIIFPKMAHDMMLEPGWESVAARIVAWLNEKNL
jgi:pimeloyl-ACP methyl ester carboxylesterase